MPEFHVIFFTLISTIIINYFLKKNNFLLDKKYFRPNEVEYLKGDASKALKDLKFKPKYTFKALVEDMINGDLSEAKKELK